MTVMKRCGSSNGDVLGSVLGDFTHERRDVRVCSGLPFELSAVHGAFPWMT